ncbi:ComEA family DNA-binding protein [Streptomyces griseosporeus]|uniref:ComEA family DNA-binding protein n=1 Tax=Streptomyces griseosporeus TaxID=1910 RepID=UPI00167E3B90|nr:ComEA family DNA-binding protein [Streptomyces griseosporeus]
MALRSRSRTAAATSGPGRFPASDSRVRHRRPRIRAGARQRQASAEELRRRAEVLFAPGPQEGQRSERWRESGAGPPPVEPRPSSEPGAEPQVGAAGTAPAGRAEGAWRARVGLAVRERMPLWLQTRCGLERRSVVALTVLLVVAVGFAVQHFWSGRTQSVQAPDVVRAAAPYGEEEAEGSDGAGGAGGAGGSRTGDEAGAGAVAVGAVGGAGAPGVAASAGAEIVVDVSGKVRHPGIHRLPAGSRVADALEAAGGVKPGTDVTSLNRARFLVDGEQVVVGVPAVGGGAGAPAGGAMAGPASGGAAAGPSVPVSLNTATVEQLDTLPGVGPVLAQHIVDYRTEHGGFRSVDELREVNGIGDRRFADLRNLVRP